MACAVFVIFMCILLQTYCQNSKEVIQITERFYDTLMKKYESSVLTNETKALIDQEINDFVNSTLRNLHVPRHKKQLPQYSAEKLGVEVFEDLKIVSTLNVIDVRDVCFFKKHDLLFKVLITSTDLVVYLIHDTRAIPITYHPAPRSSKLHVCKFIGTTWFVVERAHGIAVYHFFQRDGKFIIQEVQNIDILNMKHVSVWRHQTQMVLSVSSASVLHVYSWLEDSFKLVELLPITAKSSGFFAIDGSLNLLVLEQRKTTILNYNPSTQRFTVAQTIVKSFNDLTTMQISNGASTEYFLVLSNHQRTILYKLADDVFVPFQEITSADRVVAVVRNNSTMVLFLMKNHSLNVYQYDGWRFVRLNYVLGGIEMLKLITRRSEEHLIVKRIDSNWILTKLSWSRARVPSEYLENLKQWCVAAKDRAKEIPKVISDRKPIELSNVNLHKITVDSVNGISTEMLKKLNNSYNDLLSRLQAASNLLLQKSSLKNPKFSTLRAKIVRAKCTDKCRVNNLATELPFDITSRLRRIDDETLRLKFDRVHVDSLEGFPCPRIGLKLEDISVKGLINGISFDDLYENALRKSGDQVVSGNHVFEELHVDSIIAPNIEAASTYTRQRFKTKVIYVKELNITDGGLLLPLDGEPVTMTGTLTAKKAVFNKLIDQRGGITGRSIKKFAPMVFFMDYQELTGNYTLGNVKVTDLLEVTDVAGKSGKSLREIADNAIPLNEDVPVHLEFSSDRTVWLNITVENLPNWLTRKNARMVTVTGKKIALKNITLPDDLYSQLPLPKIETPVCSVVAITPDLRTSSIQVGRTTAKTVVTDEIEGAYDLDDLMRDCVTTLDEVDLSTKVFNGPVIVENMNLASFEGSPFESFETSMFKWYEPQVLKGPIKLKFLNVSVLDAAEGIKIPFPSEVQNLSVEGNFQVKTINGIDLDDFLRNVVRINETIALKNVVFEGSVEVDEINTTNTNINLRIVEPNVFLGNKTIIGDLEVEGDFSIPINDGYPSSGNIATYVIDGSITFKHEPDVVNINGKNLQQLIASVWMRNRPANLTGNFYMSNVTLVQPFDSYYLLSTPQFGPWATVENRLLSKTKLQEIPSTLNFRNAKVSNIITRGNSVLNCSDPYLNDLLYMTLKKNVNCIIPDKWHFEELIVAGDLKLEGKINNLNLSTDVARHDVNVNMITGKKIVKGLTAKHLHGLNFGEWARDALMQSGMDERAIVGGRKTFNNFHARILNVTGKLVDKKIETCLTKYGNQIITTPKVIKGSLHTESLLVRGSINGMNFTDVALNQLRKNGASVQTIKSSLVFNGNLHVLGNLKIKALQGIEMPNVNSINASFTFLSDTFTRLKPYAAVIEAVNSHRAKYWHKFEEVEGQVLLPVNDRSPPVALTLHHLGSCVLISVSNLQCNGHDMFYLKPFANVSTMLVNEILSVDNMPLVVQVSSGPQSRITIYQYDYHANAFDVMESIRVPGITEASVLNHNGVVWIVTLLNFEMLVLRYETWGDLQRYHLPPSSHFTLNKVPATDEPILVRDDGMWKFDGLAGPRNVFEVDLKSEKIESFHGDGQFYVRLTYRNGEIKLLKARYVGV